MAPLGVAAGASRPSRSRLARRATTRNPGHGAGSGLLTRPAPAIPVATPLTGSGGSPLPGSTPDPVTGNSSPPTQQSFTYFPMYVLDNNNGVVLYPGVNQLANLGGKVDLEAQVSGTTVSSYNWNTTGLTDATTLSATNTYQLTFTWTNSNPGAAHSDSVTLSVEDTQLTLSKRLRMIFDSSWNRRKRRLGGQATQAGPRRWHPAASCSRPHRLPAIMPRSMHRAALSTPRSTCPATTRMFPPSRSLTTRSPRVRPPSSSSRTP